MRQTPGLPGVFRFLAEKLRFEPERQHATRNDRKRPRGGQIVAEDWAPEIAPGWPQLASWVRSAREIGFASRGVIGFASTAAVGLAYLIVLHSFMVILGSVCRRDWVRSARAFWLRFVATFWLGFFATFWLRFLGVFGFGFLRLDFARPLVVAMGFPRGRRDRRHGSAWELIQAIILLSSSRSSTAAKRESHPTAGARAS